MVMVVAVLGLVILFVAADELGKRSAARSGPTAEASSIGRG
jgi:hypothetical protein